MEYSIEQTHRVDAAGVELEESVEELLDRLAKQSPVASMLGDIVSVRITVPAKGPVAALERSLRVIDKALAASGLTTLELKEFHVTSADDLARQIHDATRETYLGVTEVAELFGVSKQRVSELRRSPTFPEPVAEIAAGPVWMGSSLQRFLDAWERKPGRPREVAARS